MLKYVSIFLIFSQFSFSDDFFDKNASKITAFDLQLMQEFDELIYYSSDVKLKTLDVDAIYNFIKKHKSYISDYSLAKIDFQAGVGINSNIENNNQNYQQAIIKFTYPLFDQKSRKEIQNKKIEFNLKILNKIKEYASLRDSLISKRRELKFFRLVQIKEKLQVKKGIKYLDEKLKTIEKILILQNDILHIKSNLAIAKATLLNYVKSDYREKLKELLR